MSLVDTASAGSWETLRLSAFVKDTLSSLAFQSMTPVQASVIPLFLDHHKDVIVQAVTGSGKTLAFVIPLLEKLARRETSLKDDQVGGIIICPTRELAMQTHKVVESFLATQTAPDPSAPSSSKLKYINPSLLLIGGTTSLREDISRFRALKPDILIGTPGRMEEFLTGSSSLSSGTASSFSSRKKGKAAAAVTPSHPSMLKSVCSVKALEMLVLDEADRVLELGFQLSINRILSVLPKQRRTGCFSATMSEGLGELCRVGLRNPVRIVVKVERKMQNPKQAAVNADELERNMPATLTNTYVVCRTQEKLYALVQLLRNDISRGGTDTTDSVEPRKIIVYFATCACVDYFYKVLKPLASLSSCTLYPLHGQQTPFKRTSTYTAFVAPSAHSKAPHQVLLCTDVAARGLDLPDVDTVLQFDPPQDSKSFNHRIGRTARAGRKGKATVLLCAEGREGEYSEFMKRRGVPLREEALPAVQPGQDSVDGAKKLQEQMRKIILKDRDLHEKGVKAFVSFVRSYSKHEASYIFSISNYDLVGLARCFGLLRLPKMPELKNATGREEWRDVEVDWDTYAFADKARENQRISALDAHKTTLANATNIGEAGEAGRDADGPADQKRKRGSLSGPAAAWSKQTEAKERKELRREKKARKRAFLKSQEEGAPEEAQSLGGTAKKTGGKPGVEGEDGEDNEEEWADEERAVKRVRKSRPDQREIESAFTGLD